MSAVIEVLETALNSAEQSVNDIAEQLHRAKAKVEQYERAYKLAMDRVNELKSALSSYDD